MRYSGDTGEKLSAPAAVLYDDEIILICITFDDRCAVIWHLAPGSSRYGDTTQTLKMSIFGIRESRGHQARSIL